MPAEQLRIESEEPANFHGRELLQVAADPGFGYTKGARGLTDIEKGTG